MAVEVLKHGKDRPETAKKATCTECGALLRYWKRDIKTRQYREIDGSSGGHDYIACPDCNHEVVLKSY